MSYQEKGTDSVGLSDLRFHRITKQRMPVSGVTVSGCWVHSCKSFLSCGPTHDCLVISNTIVTLATQSGIRTQRLLAIRATALATAPPVHQWHLAGGGNDWTSIYENKPLTWTWMRRGKKRKKGGVCECKIMTWQQVYVKAEREELEQQDISRGRRVGWQCHVFGIMVLSVPLRFCLRTIKVKITTDFLFSSL